MRLILSRSYVFFPPQSRRFRGLLPKQSLNEHSNHFAIRFNWKLMDWRDLICSGPGKHEVNNMTGILLARIADWTPVPLRSLWHWRGKHCMGKWVLDGLARCHNACLLSIQRLDDGVKLKQAGRDRRRPWSYRVIMKPVKKLEGDKGCDTY